MPILREMLTSTDEELLVAIGNELQEDQLGAIPKPLAKILEEARIWTEQSVAESRLTICTNPTVRQLAGEGFSTELVAAIVALLESLALGTAASPLAILLCKRGLSSLCEDEWTLDP